ncbi:M55 family metallopeptidase [Krasilnikovia sp. MM14-A1259]|uniref:M55 family metallopeptidase n=1 Tax=Krasilnikovia sp. MM14-A1259 TaxID=3373539 RepID=UPI00381064CB
MKVLISADMEGATGVTTPDDCAPGHPRWEYCRRLLTSDVNAAVSGFAAAGADEILVNEAHADQRNLLLDRLDTRASLLIGAHKPLGMMEGIDRSPDAVAFVGYHTGAGELGVLAHTYLPNSITSVRVNGVPASEGRMNALLAAEYGVPVVLVTGDDLTCADAAGYAPHAVAVPVKTCVDRYSAICLPPAVSTARISEGARRALRSPPRPSPDRPGTYRYEVSFDAAHLAPLATCIPGVERTDDLSVEFTLPTMHTAIRCFRALTRLVTSGIEPDYG